MKKSAAAILSLIGIVLAFNGVNNERLNFSNNVHYKYIDVECRREESILSDHCSEARYNYFKHRKRDYF